MKRWRKGPPRALRAPRVAPERPCWPRQPQSSPAGAGACVPRLSPSLLMAALGGGPYSPAAPCVDKQRSAQVEQPRAPRAAEGGEASI